MDTNIVSALLTATISVVFGGVVSYILYVQTIGKWYSKIKNESKHAKIKYWCGILSLLAITQGVIIVARELINSLSNNTEIRIDSVAKGIVAVILYPLIFAVIAAALTFFIKEEKDKKLERSENSQEENTKDKNSNNSKILAFLAIVIILLIGIQIIPYLKTTEKEKTFLVESCISCKDDGCKPTINFIKFRVSPPFVYIHYISDGVEKINIYPENANDSCVILKDNNFSFSCERLRDYGLTRMEGSNSFDGKNTYQSKNKATFGEKIIVSRQVCQIK